MSDDDQPKNYLLPASIAQPRDVNRIVREINTVDEHLRQEAVRHPDKKFIIKASDNLNYFLSTNQIDILNADQRADAIGWLEELGQTAPVINISFGEEAPEEIISKVADWFRREIDPRCLIIVGLEPTIGIGSIVRTPNKVFDLSLKSRFKQTQGLLVDAIHKIATEAKQCNLPIYTLIA